MSRICSLICSSCLLMVAPSHVVLKLWAFGSRQRTKKRGQNSFCPHINSHFPGASIQKGPSARARDLTLDLLPLGIDLCQTVLQGEPLAPPLFYRRYYYSPSPSPGQGVRKNPAGRQGAGPMVIVDAAQAQVLHRTESTFTRVSPAFISK